MNRETMTPVDEFAKSAMSAITNRLTTPEGYDNITINVIAREAYEIADEMMKEKFKRDTNLCNDCKKHPATCKADPVFGLGLGCDNVVKCNLYRKKDNHRIRTFFRRKYFSIINYFKH
jgi:hypothetical protein